MSYNEDYCERFSKKLSLPNMPVRVFKDNLIDENYIIYEIVFVCYGRLHSFIVKVDRDKDDEFTEKLLYNRLALKVWKLRR